MTPEEHIKEAERLVETPSFYQRAQIHALIALAQLSLPRVVTELAPTEAVKQWTYRTSDGSLANVPIKLCELGDLHRSHFYADGGIRCPGLMGHTYGD